MLIVPVLFEYLAFSTVVFIFPWSWNAFKQSQRKRAIVVGLAAIMYALLYTFGLAFFEWIASEIQYNFWQAYIFASFHSSLLALTVYSIIALLMLIQGGVISPTTEPKYLKKIAFKHKSQTQILLVKNIMLLEAEGNYINVFTADGNRVLIRKTLKNLERQLDPNIFIRIHRKYIINLQAVKSFESHDNGGYMFNLISGNTVKMSKSYVENLAQIKSFLK